MRKVIRYIYLVLFLAFAVGFVGAEPVFADANNFYFDSFEADYYVYKGDDGYSKMHVVEKLVAVFPETNQNHGITRFIPYTTNEGKTVTASSMSALNLKVTRNGVSEPIAKSDVEDGAYIFNIGSKSVYVHGRQEYTLEYDFENVILSYGKDGFVTYDDAAASHQELYWDTNGTGWKQKFSSVVARVHFVDGEDGLTGEVSCYVGKQGMKGEKCYYYEIEDGYEFSALDLTAYMNLTFDIELKAGTFKTRVTYNYMAIGVGAILFVILFVVVIVASNRRSKVREKREFYKGSPVPPQYTAMKGVSVADAEVISMENVKSSKVATLMDLAVKHKIELVKMEKKTLGRQKWSIRVKDAKNLTEPEKIVLQILNGGDLPEAGSTFEVKTRSYSSSLAVLAASYTSGVKSRLKVAGYLEPEVKTKSSASLSSVVISMIIFTFVSVSLPMMVEALSIGGVLLGGVPMIIADIAMFFAIFVVPAKMNGETKKYEERTKQGLEAAIYLKGLKLYMTMAEKERLEVLQSVKGADTSPKGIVKLYEKLLPFAVLFGVEESWMEELNKYYEMDGVGQPVWYVGHGPIVVSDFNSFSSRINSSISSSTIRSSSGSSGSSGGGGGGHSGGGGGGGGGGGW